MGLLDDLVRDAVSDVLGPALGLTDTPITITRHAEAYDGTQGLESGVTDTVHTVYASPPIEYTLREINGKTILAGDKKFLIAAKDLPIEPDPQTDRLTHAGKVYKIVDVDVTSSGDQSALYTVQVRL